jgi:hypothetical protein
MIQSGMLFIAIVFARYSFVAGKEIGFAVSISYSFS